MRSRRGLRARSLADFAPRRGGTSARSIRATLVAYGELSVTVNGSSLILTFPEPTPSVNPFHGRHWGMKLRERRKWGWYCQAAALKVREYRDYPPLPMSPAVCSITRYGGRHVDEDNCIAGAKFLIDSLVASGFFVDDSPKHLKLPRPRQVIGTERKTVVTISASTREEHENGDGI